MNKENKVISIAVGDRLQIEGVGTVELVVVAPETPEQPKQHPLVGKWVRCLNNGCSSNFKKNEWYQVLKDPFEYFAIKDIGGSGSGFQGVNHERFDPSNPCDFDCNMPEAINPKYKVGDEVVVVDNGQVASTHAKAFWFLELCKKVQNNGFALQKKAIIFNRCYCPHNQTNLYALRDSEGNECVICQAGIKLAGIDKQEWLDATSRLFDSWMKISGGFVAEQMRRAYYVKYSKESNRLIIDHWNLSTVDPLIFENRKQAEQFLSENEKDLKTFFHQV
jgi:hypothetical protein